MIAMGATSTGCKFRWSLSSPSSGTAQTHLQQARGGSVFVGRGVRVVSILVPFLLRTLCRYPSRYGPLTEPNARPFERFQNIAITLRNCYLHAKIQPRACSLIFLITSLSFLIVTSHVISSPDPHGPFKRWLNAPCS